jgi:rRNA maturation endonuclease Nob1
MLKLQNKNGETIFQVQDNASKPEKVIDWNTECVKCHQSGEGKPGEYPCPLCGRNLLWDDNLEEEEE